MVERGGQHAAACTNVHRPAADPQCVEGSIGPHQNLQMLPGIARWVKTAGQCEGFKWKRKDALAGDGRWANEEANLPVAGNDDGIGLGGGSSQLNDEDNSRRGDAGDHRVHHDAKLAVIRVSIARVKVRDLSYGQHRQQD